MIKVKGKCFFISKTKEKKNYPYYVTSLHSYSAQKNSPSPPHN